MAEPIVPAIEPTVLTIEPTAKPSRIAVSKAVSKGWMILLLLLRHKK